MRPIGVRMRFVGGAAVAFAILRNMGRGLLKLSALATLLLFVLPNLAIAQIDLDRYRTIFGERVLVFRDDMDREEMQRVLAQIHENQRGQEFTDQRYALLFKPGTYELDVTVDFYVQALGLGRTPDETVIHGSVQSIHVKGDNKVTTEFWRGAENFKVYMDPTERWMYWAVSQAAPMRRMHIVGNVNFDKHGWASGGVLANSVVTGRAGLTSGQQWFTRNAELGSWEGGNWNRVFVGVNGAPGDSWPEVPITVVESAPVIRDKPFLTFDEESGYSVFVPQIQYESVGVSWKGGREPGRDIPIERFHIARPDEDDAYTINQALADGKHLLFTPGIYLLEEAIVVANPNTVIMGLGLPTLVPIKGKAAMTTLDEEGIVIAGVMVDAGPESSEVLIRIGPETSANGHAKNPISLHDLYCRVGGAIVGTAKTCVEINADHVIGDHLWLWRADHGQGADWAINKSEHGLVVNGDDVTIYGLFNEHFQHYQTYWNGERGRVYFYQSEIPYEPPSHEAWNDDGKAGYASYKVAEHVSVHQAWGLGIYSFFRGEAAEKNNIRLENAMEVPERPGVRITHITVFAGRLGGINHVINGMGPATNVGELNFFDGLNHE